MKKVIVVLLLILSTVISGFYANNGGNKTVISTAKVDQIDLSASILIAGKGDLATAD